MRRRIIRATLILALLLTGILAFGIEAQAASAAEVATVHITLKDEKTISWLNRSKENKAEGTLVLTSNGEDTVLQLTDIHGRGQSSWDFARKKGYSIKVANDEGKKVELIDGAGKAKGWNLIACGVITHDTTFLNNMTAMRLFEQIGGASALKYRMIELYVNDEYQGVYMLTEKVQINKERIDLTETEAEIGDGRFRKIDSDTENLTAEEKSALKSGIRGLTYYSGAELKAHGGFVIESGIYYTKNSDGCCGFTTSRDNALELKDPEECSLAQMSQIAAYVQEFEDALYSPSGCNSLGKHYSEYIDLESLARYVAVDSFGGDRDIFFSSSYFYAETSENGVLGPMVCGPLWDMNYYRFTDSLAEMRERDKGDTSDWLRELFTKGDFAAELAKQSERLLPLIQKMNSEDAENNDTVTAYIAQISDAMERNDRIWCTRFTKKSAAYQSAFDAHVTEWTAMWSDSSRLKGVTAEHHSGVIHAEVIGTADSFQWYRIDKDGYSASAIEGACTADYTPQESGLYYCEAAGNTITESRTGKLSSNIVRMGAFLDVSAEDYFAAAANWAVEQKITDGTGNGRFSPNDFCTRGQVVTFLWRESGSPKSNTGVTFSDVHENDFYAEAVSWAVAQGITNGTGENAFSPNEIVTRAEVVTFLSRAAGIKEDDVTAENRFADVPEEAYYYDAVLWAAENGITTGVNDTTFAPKNNCTRAEVVTFLYRWCVQ